MDNIGDGEVPMGGRGMVLTAGGADVMDGRADDWRLEKENDGSYAVCDSGI